MGELSEKGAASAAPTSVASYDNGIEIQFFSEPKRKYEIRRGEVDGPNVTEWREVPSVTTVLECLDKPALPWWGMETGAEGVIQLYNTGFLFPVEVNVGGSSQLVLGLKDEIGQTVVAGRENVAELLKRQQLTTNHVKRRAGDRGQSCHDALELWAKSGELPDVAMFPPQEQGYVMALVQFLKDLDPEPVANEVIVGSLEHGFAGRYDVRLLVRKERRVVTHHTPVKGPQYTVVPPGIHLDDLKTSKRVYFTHPKQLAAYELASVECGLEPSSARAVIHCDAEGNYRYVRADQWATPEDFLTTLAEYNSQLEMKKRKPPGGSH